MNDELKIPCIVCGALVEVGPALPSVVLCPEQTGNNCYDNYYNALAEQEGNLTDE